MGLQFPAILRIHLSPSSVTRNVTDGQTAAQCDGSCQYCATRDVPGTSLTQTTNSLTVFLFFMQFSGEHCSYQTAVFSSDGTPAALALISTSTKCTS